MNILLDTHVLLWWLADSPSLSQNARILISDPCNTIFVSAATAWEISIKQSLGKLHLDGNLADEIDKMDFEVLSITLEHAAEVKNLPAIHKDPFDRMLAAQAIIENIHLLSADASVLRYPAKTIRA